MHLDSAVNKQTKTPAPRERNSLGRTQATNLLKTPCGAGTGDEHHGENKARNGLVGAGRRVLRAIGENLINKGI